jgi:hypothetical protein
MGIKEVVPLKEPLSLEQYKRAELKNALTEGGAVCSSTRG